MGGLQPICLFLCVWRGIMKKVFKDKVFLKTMLILAIPITLQSFITSSLNLVDTLMVGSLKEAAISAVGLANQYMFIFTLCLMGINAGANVFMSQLWGKRDEAGIKTFLGVDLTIGLIASSLFGALAFFGPHMIMNIMSDDPEVIELGINYLKIVAVSCIFMNFTQGYSAALRSTEQTKLPMYGSLIGVTLNVILNWYLKIVAVSCIFMNFTQGYSAALRSTEQTKLPMYGSLIGVTLNVILNWVFIFGKLGAPAMGVEGAALATMLSRLVEMLFIVGIVYMSKNRVAAKFKEMFNYNWRIIGDYFKTSWSVIANELIFAVGSAAYSIAYAKISTNASATMQISSTIINMFFIFLTGIGTAASIMIGNKIGAKEEKRAKEYASHVAMLTISSTIINMFFIFLTGIGTAASIMIGNKIGAKEEKRAKEYASHVAMLTPFIGIFLGVSLWMSAPIVATWFDIQPETYQSTITVLRIMALFMPLRSFNAIMIIGVFRGGADTTYSMVVQATTIMGYSVPLAFIGALVLKWPVHLVFLLVCSEEMVKMPFELWRLKSGRWMRNIVS